MFRTFVLTNPVLKAGRDLLFCSALDCRLERESQARAGVAAQARELAAGVRDVSGYEPIRGSVDGDRTLEPVRLADEVERTSLRACSRQFEDIGYRGLSPSGRRETIAKPLNCSVFIEDCSTRKMREYGIE